jgi:A nuclease family of the HNH/ENDO VII superfamily with conserved AHH
MTEVGEGVAVVVATMEQPQKCEFKPDETTWTCKLDGDSDLLGKNLTRHCGVVKPSVPKTVKDVSSSCWPCQAHHLIPWQQLEKHPVTQWVAKSPPKGASKVLDDTRYSVDHGKNGKFMPDCWRLEEWAGATEAGKRKVAEAVMGAVGIQLHQSAHSYKSYGVGEAGYKTRVAEYLDRINANALDHIKICPECREKSQDGKVPPRDNVVVFLDKTSERLEVDINLGRIFVSRRAAEFVAAGGVTG